MSEAAHRPYIRGISARDLRNFDAAEALFRESLAHDPQFADAHMQLALCLNEMDDRREEALAEIDAAIAIDPEDSVFHIVRSSILAGLRKGDAALKAAESALELEPDSPHSYTAVARAQLARERWADAETAARAALGLDGDDESAQSILAVALRMQGKREEDEIAVERLLSENPEDKFTHLNAGFSALRRFDHAKAETHFRESLRLDASFEPAREGLVESFRARSRFYRVYQRYCFWMARFSQGNRWVLIIGLYLGFRFGRVLLTAIHPALGVAFVALYLIFVFWIWLARGVGNFLIFLDRSARFALKRAERLEALAVGGGFIIGLTLALNGAILKLAPLIAVGGALALGAIPASLTFTNESKPGRLLFGGVLAAVYIAGLGIAATAGIGGAALDAFITLGGFAALAVMICTWLGNIPALNR